MSTISILTYHSLDSSGSVVSTDPLYFARQMACLAERGCRGISLQQALDYREQHGEWPERSVVLTFDDGFANFYTQAFPVLERHGFTATVFVVTSHMGGRSDWEVPHRELGILPILTWSQAAELIESGIEIGSHTRHHRDLRRCSPSEAKDEMRTSYSDIKENLGVSARSFAYPYGGVNHLIQHLAGREFNVACTTELRRAGHDPLNLLPRIDVYYLRSLRRFADLVDGKLDQYLTVRRCGRLARRIFVPTPATVKESGVEYSVTKIYSR